MKSAPFMYGMETSQRYGAFVVVSESFLFFLTFLHFFCFSLFILFSRKLGLCIHSAVGMISEWGKRNPIEFENRYKKNKDNRKRATSNDIVEHLQASVFNKKRSRAREQAHEYCKKRKLL